VSDTHARGKNRLVFLNTSDVLNGRILNHSYTEVTTWPGQAKKSIRRNDILFSEIRPANGRFAFVDIDADDYVVSTKLMVIRSDPKLVMSRFLFHFLTQKKIFDWLQVIAESRSGTFPQITFDQVAELKLPLPSVEEQQKICRFADALGARIFLLDETNAKLEAIVQTIFKSWFVDFDPVRAKAEGREPDGIDADTAALFPADLVDSKLGDIPRGWRVTTLGSELSVIETGSRPKGGVNGIDVGVPSVGAESIVGIGRFDYGKTKFVARDFFSGMRKGHVSDGDVLLYKDGGRPGVFIPHVTMVGNGFPFEEYCINEHVYRLRARPPIPQAFLFFWLCTDFATEEMKNRGTGVAIPGLNSTAVRGVSLLLPTEEILVQFAGLVDPIVLRILENSKMIHTLSLIRDTLLPRLISGKLRIDSISTELKEL